MSQRVVTQVIYTDDLDGSTATHTALVGWEGRFAEIDLSDPNFAKVDALMQPLLEKGRKVSPEAVAKRAYSFRTPIDPDSAQRRKDLRKWVDDNNIRNRSGTDVAYRTNNGSGAMYYPDWLWKQYDEYLAGQAKVA